MRQRESVLGTRGVLEWDPGTAGHFHYRQVLGLVVLASGEQTVLEVNCHGQVKESCPDLHLPRHGSSRIKHTLRTDARDFGATPPRSASMSVVVVV